jgi:hypothetical protein
MNTIQKIILGTVALVVLVIGVRSLGGKTLGDATVSNYPTWYYNGIVIGSDNVLLNDLDMAQCTPTGAVSIANGNQENITCSYANARAGDKMTFTAETLGGASSNAGFPVTAGKASAGTLTFTIVNSSGSTQTPTVPAIDFALFR